MEVEASVIQLQNGWYLSVPCTQGKRYLWGTVENLILTGNQVGQNGILRPSGTRPSGDGAEHPTGRGQKEAGCQPAAGSNDIVSHLINSLKTVDRSLRPGVLAGACAFGRYRWPVALPVS